MLHKNRLWSVTNAESAEWLAEHLTGMTYCGCCGFRLTGYLFVNDATCADGAQEYAVLREDRNHYVQIESLTFSWMDKDEALALIRSILAGDYDNESYDEVASTRLESPDVHGRCYLCA